MASESLIELGNRAQTPQFGVKWTGGRFEIGKIPIDQPFLIHTFYVKVNGSPVAYGRDAHLDAARIVKAGDNFELRWSAPYARRIEFGFSGQDVLGRRFNQKGRLFATTAYAAWPSIIAELKARISKE